MRVTLFMASSVNGIIARPDYREDFLSRPNWTMFLDCVRETGALVWGRKTHEKLRTYGPQGFAELASFTNVVVSARTDFAADEPGFVRAGSPHGALEVLRLAGCTRATLAGGSILNAAFAAADLIDEVVLNVEAVVIGRGIPLFADGQFDLRFRLQDVRQVTDTILQLRYDRAR